MRPLVSVVVPMYKCEPYLRKCLDSLVKQTLKEIEIICVNDGSPDNSTNIVLEYQKKDKRIVIINQKNKGLAEARNVGMKKVHAPYVMFCDSDDFYDLDMCEKMYHAIHDNGVDIACCGSKIYYESCEEKKKSDEKYYKINFSGKQKVSSEHFFSTDVSAWNKIFQIELIKKYKIFFPKGLLYEDGPFFFKYLTVSSSIYYLPEKLYNYLRRSGSIMTETFKKSPRAIDHIKIMADIYCFLNKRGFLQKWKKEFLMFYLNSFGFSAANIPTNCKKNLYQTAWSIMKKFSAKDISVLSFWQQEQWRQILKRSYNQKKQTGRRQESERIALIKQTPKIEWDKLFKQYELMSENIYELWNEEILKSDILTDTNDWLYLIWICLLLQKKEDKVATRTLAKYVAGVNKLKHIEQFLPVADLAEKMGYTNDRIHKAALVFRALEKNKKKFEKLLHRKTVAIVGNGPSEVGKGKGPEIDTHDIVIRINNYRTEGFEADYGTKTDIWVRGFGGEDLLDYTAKNKYLFAGITGSYHTIPLYWDFQLDILYRDLIENKIATGYLSCDLYEKLVQLTHIAPTTGFSTLYAVQNLGCKKVDVYGFSFQQQKADGYATHYFNDRSEQEAKERSLTHSWNKETEWIKRMFDSNFQLPISKHIYLNPHFYHVQNTGDLESTPIKYFDSLFRFKEIDLSDINVNGYKFLKSKDVILFGGGLLNEFDLKNFFFENTICKKIAWGIGLLQSQKYKYLFSDFDLIGVRDFNRPEIDNKKVFYVPCASCMSNLFDDLHEQKYRLCFYAHKLETPSEIFEKFRKRDIPILDNEAPFEKVVQFLAQAEYVITNSYHGTYWATLLGKKVLCVPFNDKFYGFKHAPTYTTFDTYEEDMKKAIAYPEALNEARNINLSFYKKVKKLIKITSR